MIARLVNVRHLWPKHDSDYFLYTFGVTKTIRGDVPAKLVVFSSNDTGRVPFDAVEGHQYLLFLLRPWKEETWWRNDNCGNSGEVRERQSAIKTIESIPALRGAEITGEVTSNDPAVRVPNATVIATNKTDKAQFRARTQKNGRFRLHVPAGEYSVEVTDGHTHFVTHWLSYDDADSLALEDGACAQLAFVPLGSPDGARR